MGDRRALEEEGGCEVSFRAGTKVYVTREHNSVWGDVPMKVSPLSRPNANVVIATHPNLGDGGFEHAHLRLWSQHPKTRKKRSKR